MSNYNINPNKHASTTMGHEGNLLLHHYTWCLRSLGSGLVNALEGAMLSNHNVPRSAAWLKMRFRIIEVGGEAVRLNYMHIHKQTWSAPAIEHSYPQHARAWAWTQQFANGCDKDVLYKHLNNPSNLKFIISDKLKARTRTCFTGWLRLAMPPAIP